ncbi:Aste57867_19032 [Aphanomyces stellatus]|uniref:Aste57867_19032 protein n=1 Tax=Aphanomyces stellatus TaxID=120398 RepID=A0A485LBW6_9STRA|nr:hypothetical protein As57867_018968 [Aphanomyces stellatus]VFT95757.1 Aste57867_19032 [Aphanomyces stellatus]
MDDDGTESPKAAVVQPPTKINMQLIRKCMNLPRGPTSADDDPDAEVDALLKKTTLRLDWLNIGKIENLDVFSHIRELYLQHNAIARIENLDFHTKLEFLVLSYNQLTTVENVRALTNLKFLDLSHNHIPDVNLDELPPSLRVLRLAGNPVVETFQNYHVAMFAALPLLTTCDHFDRSGGMGAADSPTNHERPRGGKAGDFAGADSRDAIKQLKERMSARHMDKMREVNASLDDEKNQMVDRFMLRGRERRQKLQKETQSYMEDAASRMQTLHAKHASWREAQLGGAAAASHAS